MWRIAGKNWRGVSKVRTAHLPLATSNGSASSAARHATGKAPSATPSATTTKAVAAQRQIELNRALATQPNYEVALAHQPVLVEIGNRVHHRKRHDQQRRHQ